MALPRRPSEYRSPTLLFAAALAALLPACGGGGGGGSTETLAKQVFATNEDAPLAVSLLAPAEFAGGSWAVVEPPAHGSVSLVAGSGALQYTPSADFNGVDTLEVTVTLGQRSARGEVELQVAPVADAATLSLPINRPELRGGYTHAVSVRVVDPDGVASVTVTQTGGTVALTGLSHGANGITATAPQVARVETVELTLAVSDPAAPAGPWTVTVHVLPTAGNGDFRTIVGAPGSPAVHWVIVSDGYQVGEYDKFRRDAQYAVDFLYGQGDLAPLAGAWNVHLLWAASAQSGVDVPSEGIFVDTAFDAALDCAGIGRLLCVDWGAVTNALTAVAPWYDHALVLVNTTRYGGAGGGIATATTHIMSGDLVLHEMGHSHAGLGDEYVDLQIGGSPPPENQYPNLTVEPTAANAKWSRWFADPGAIPTQPGQTGIGHFEGGYYIANGVWRPSDISAMRALGYPLDAVGAEAWALRTYARAAPISTATPTPGAVAATAGATLTFTVDTLLAPAYQELRWFVDGIEVPQWQGLREVTVAAPATSGSRTVEARPRDTTGLIHPSVTGTHDLPATWTITVP